MDVGEQLFMVLSDAKTEQPTARKTAMRVVGLLDTNDTWTVSAQTAVLSLAQLRALVPAKATDAVTSLAVYLKEAEDRNAWAEAFAGKVDAPGHQVLSAVELQREPTLLRDSARSVCEGAPTAKAATPPVKPPKLLDCTAVETSAGDLKYLRTLVGDVILDVAPQYVPASFAIAGGKQLATTSAPLQWVVGWLLTAQRARYAQLLGLPGDRLDVLRARVSSGSLDELSATGGVAVPSGLAAELGVRAGDTLALGQLTPPNRQGPQLPAGLRQLKVAAIVSFPLEAVSPLSMVVFAHTDYVRSMTPATATVAAVHVAEPRPIGWLDDLRIASHARPLLIAQSGHAELSRQRQVLKTTCK